MADQKKIKIICVDDLVANTSIVLDLLIDFPSEMAPRLTNNPTSYKKLVKEFNPDIAIIDIYFGDQPLGLEILEWTTREAPQTRSIILSESDEFLSQLLTLNAHGFIYKRDFEILPKAIRTVYKGRYFFPKPQSSHYLELTNIEQYIV